MDDGMQDFGYIPFPSYLPYQFLSFTLSFIYSLGFRNNNMLHLV